MSGAARERPRKSRLGLVLLVVVFGLIAAWAAGLFGSGTTVTGLAFEARPYVMFGLVPSFTRQGELTKTSNALGYRGAEIAIPKPAGTTRIVCLGGSTTYGWQVNDDEAWPAVLQELLNDAAPDLTVEVVNAGVESYTSAESLANLAFRVLELQPDLLVVHHAANDVRPRRYANFVPSYDHYRKVWNGSPTGYDPQGGELSGINFFIQQAHPAEAGEPLANLAAAGTGTFLRNMISMLGVAEAHGLPLVLTTLPYDAEGAKADPGLGPGIDEHNALLRGLASQRGVPLVDLAARFSGNGFIDPIHLDAAGCREKAQLMANGLVDLLP